MPKPRVVRVVPRWRSDDRASVLGLPFKLLLAGVLLAITVPAGYLALQSYSRDSAEEKIAVELGQLEAAARQVVAAGVGTRQETNVDFTGTVLGALAHVAVGGDLDENLVEASTIRFQVEGRSEQVRQTDPLVYLTGADGRSVRFGEGEFSVTLTHKRDTFNGIAIDYVEVRP